MKKLPDHLRRSITWDRGSELADFDKIQLELGTMVFLCWTPQPTGWPPADHPGRSLTRCFDRLTFPTPKPPIPSLTVDGAPRLVGSGA